MYISKENNNDTATACAVLILIQRQQALGGKKFIICPVKKGTGAPRNEAKWTTSEFPGSGEVVVVIVYIIIWPRK